MTVNTWTGSGDWTADAAANWSLGHEPTSSEDAVLSGSGTITLPADRVCKSLDCTGFTGTLDCGSGVGLQVYGAATFAAGMTLADYTLSLYFYASGALTSAGKKLVTIGGADDDVVVTLADDTTAQFIDADNGLAWTLAFGANDLTIVSPGDESGFVDFGANFTATWSAGAHLIYNVVAEDVYYFGVYPDANTLPPFVVNGAGRLQIYSDDGGNGAFKPESFTLTAGDVYFYPADMSYPAVHVAVAGAAAFNGGTVTEFGSSVWAIGGAASTDIDLDGIQGSMAHLFQIHSAAVVTLGGALSVDSISTTDGTVAFGTHTLTLVGGNDDDNNFGTDAVVTWAAGAKLVINPTDEYWFGFDGCTLSLPPVELRGAVTMHMYGSNGPALTMSSFLLNAPTGGSLVMDQGADDFTAPIAVTGAMTLTDADSADFNGNEWTVGGNFADTGIALTGLVGTVTGTATASGATITGCDFTGGTMLDATDACTDGLGNHGVDFGAPASNPALMMSRRRRRRQAA